MLTCPITDLGVLGFACSYALQSEVTIVRRSALYTDDKVEIGVCHGVKAAMKMVLCWVSGELLKVVVAPGVY